ncbi:MAG: SusC/RagA family TonB-linked outer membrane protein [Bacteroidales bacterium]|nr:SusC/RagA family TonB-linked outer membrane protein [Bacteroidales bacterium]
MKKLMLLFAFFSILGMQVYAQKTVTGTVTDDAGDVLPGASVLVKGTTVGTMTLGDGTYSIDVPEGSNTLVFSYIAMETQEVAISGDVIDVTLKPSSEALEEIVVTALGISKDKKSLGYSVQNVSGDEFTKARETNIVNSLSGQIAGVQVTNSSGAVGASSRIVLRGSTSITGNNEPLFVVDGIPINNSNYGSAASYGGFDTPSGAADINPDDIESISVLKGANAAALYGSRAANGVILIQTKTGKGSKGLGVSFNSGLTVESPLILPDFQNSYGQGASNNFFEFIDGHTGSGAVDESWGMPLDIGLEAVQFTTNGASPEPWVSVPDNIKNFYDLGITHNENLALTGGNEDASFRLSATNLMQTGIVPNTDFNRITLNGSATANLSEKLYAGLSINYIKSGSDNLPTVGYNNENPVQQMIWAGRNVDFTQLRDYENLPLSADNTAAAGTPLNWNTRFQNNPYWVLNTNLNGLSKDRLIGNVKMGYKITDYLTAQVRSGTDYWSSVTTQRKAFGSNEYPNGFYSEVFRTWYETNSDVLIMFNKDLSEDLVLGLNLGGNQMKTVYNRIVGQAPQLELNGVYNLSNVKSGVTAVLTNYNSERRVNSVYFNGSLAFRNYLFLEFSGRNDWSSVLPVDNNSFFYPSVSLSADVTEMASIKSNILSYLKVRGSYAIVGGDGALGPYALRQTFSFRTDPWGDVLLPYNGTTLNNPNLVSETTTSMEFGFDARLFGGRANVEFSYYNSESKDLLVPVEVSASTGYLSAWDNVGEMSNSGIEIQFGADVLKTKDFNWHVNLNWSKYNNEVVSLGGLESLTLGGQWNMSLQARPGMPYGVIFGSVYARDPEGNIIYKNGLPTLDDEYQVIGNIQPDWTGGISNTITYKGISASVLIDAKMGGDVHSMTTTWGRYAGILSETLEGRETGVVGEGVIDNGNGTYSTNDIVVTAEAFNKAAYSNNNVESSVFDASYIKLRQATLGYTLPKKLLSNLPIRDLSISLVGRNLALLYSNIPHIDPETAFSSANGEQGQEFGQLPSTRSIGFNINFKF